jgi:hypothetical protein
LVPTAVPTLVGTRRPKDRAIAGSIRPRPDKGADTFELRVFLGRDAAGRVRHKSTLFRGSQRAAERELARLVTAQDVEPSVVSDDTSRRWGPATTVNDAITGWKHNGWQDLSPSTTRRYASIWSTHVEGSIGRRKIASLGPYDVELYLRGLKTKGLSEASVRQTRAMLHRACRLARKWSGNMLANPVADTELPDWAIHEQRDVVRALAVEEDAHCSQQRGRSTTGATPISTSSPPPACAAARRAPSAGRTSTLRAVR